MLTSVFFPDCIYVIEDTQEYQQHLETEHNDEELTDTDYDDPMNLYEIDAGPSSPRHPWELRPGENMYYPYKPKLTRSEIESLRPTCIFALTSITNKEMRDVFSTNDKDDLRLVSLNAVPSALTFGRQVVLAESPLEAISICNTEMDLSTHHGQFLMVMKVTLLYYLSLFLVRPNVQYEENYHEHRVTFWIEFVIPMFRYLDTANYGEGVGINQTYGKFMVMVTSSGAQEEVFAQSRVDTKRLMQSAMAILRAEVTKYRKASVGTFVKRRILIVHTIADKMILIEVSLTKRNKYKLVELRSATIAYLWCHRSCWLGMFGLLAHTMEILQEQVEVCHQLNAEHCGELPVLNYNRVSDHLGD
ncbi:hypothetical protein INT44_001481 [Umbelopsis vinacea]|uniref:Uncharacterized protein n=1 Tax=Umbelopsis vinacea TaxID=44442 RepID=A0A8H7PQP2_9FUNG|nr:hypothetical protein INT44_001481 [Umbelopsis vinacea]